MKKHHGFTLIELLVVVAIIALLIALLLPQLAKAKEEAKLVKCGANLHEIAVSLAAYNTQNKDHMPNADSWKYGDPQNASNPWTWPAAGDNRLPLCWSDCLYIDGDVLENSNQGGHIDNNGTWQEPSIGYGIFQCPKHSSDYQLNSGKVPSDTRILQGYSLSWCANSHPYDVSASTGLPTPFYVLARNLNPSHIMVMEANAFAGVQGAYPIPAHMQYSSGSGSYWQYGIFERHLRNSTLGSNYLFADSHVEFSIDYGWAPSPLNYNSNRTWTVAAYSGPSTLPNGRPNTMMTSRVWAQGTSDR